MEMQYTQEVSAGKGVCVCGFAAVLFVNDIRRIFFNVEMNQTFHKN